MNKNTVTYYVCVVNDQYPGPKRNIGKFMGDYDFISSSPRDAALFNDKACAERRAASFPYLSVIPLTMTW